MEKPLLLLDVDGPLNAYAANHNTVLKRKLEKLYVYDGQHWPSGWATEEAYKAYKKALKARQKASFYANRPSSEESVNRKVYQLYFAPELPTWLTTLSEAFELAWCTTWGEGANNLLAPHFGLPKLPVVPFTPEDRKNASLYQHWKTKKALEFANSRPFLWFDDEVSKHDRKNLRARFGENRARSYFVAPGQGLTEKDVVFALEWAKRVPGE